MLRQLIQESLETTRTAREEILRPQREDFCTLLGELRTLLQTSFAHIAASDPRSTESSYHFFLREFADEARDSILLLNKIRELEIFVGELRRVTIGGLPLTPENLARILRVIFIEKEQEQKKIPSGEGWRVLASFLLKLRDELVPRMRQVYGLEGIRYEDKNHLSSWGERSHRELHPLLGGSTRSVIASCKRCRACAKAKKANRPMTRCSSATSRRSSPAPRRRCRNP